MAMKMYGRWKGVPKPKTEEQLAAIHERFKIGLPRLTKLEMHWGWKGPGHTGIRRFRAFKIPNIRHWHPDVEITEERIKTGTPLLKYTLDDGSTHTLDCNGLHCNVILDKLQRACSTKTIKGISNPPKMRPKNTNPPIMEQEQSL
eukprot:CAMPEP_0177649054 /NCGR_PEP_ID=MMETSP0447-20121125/11163_1 /TAXON_ID=0 /ORGANISM="Stygamoeba regulata, Strain BSH-02190019" /LENGTH=144 /DNA_ID=CAMNT_0019151749 /DNA_START=86 /DNA_END=520 /DNA_ORIENTATION=+